MVPRAGIKTKVISALVVQGACLRKVRIMLA